MTQLNKNLAANIIGKFWTALVSVIFLPFYIKAIGIEAYGIVGLYTTFIALFSLLDLGLSTTLNRELARMAPERNSAEEFGNLTRTLEVIYWPMGVLICGVIMGLSPFLSNHWLNASELTTDALQQAIFFIGIALAFQWPFSLYSGGLMGLQKQVLLNGINVVVASSRAVGTLLVLYFISPTIQAFFICQIIINFSQTIVTAFLLWRNLPKRDRRAKFDRSVLWRVKGFAIGISGISILSTLLTQMDKIILSKALSLEMFGYYSFAVVVAGSLFYIIAPVFHSFFPRFSQLIALKDRSELRRIYHLGCQVMSTLILPASALLVYFSSELVYLWTQNRETAEKTGTLISLLIIGNLLNGFMTLPYGLQLAYGWTKLSFYKNLVGITLIIPLLFAATYFYGAIGAAFAWIGLNLGYFFIEIPIMHSKVLKQEKWKWYFQDTTVPLLAVFIISTIGWMYFPKGNSMTNALYLFGIFLSSLFAAGVAMPVSRSWVINRFLRRSSMLKKEG